MASFGRGVSSFAGVANRGPSASGRRPRGTNLTDAQPPDKGKKPLNYHEKTHKPLKGDFSEGESLASDTLTSAIPTPASPTMPSQLRAGRRYHRSRDFALA